jgi:hypothetical protein
MKRLVAASKFDIDNQNQRWKKGGIMKIKIFLTGIIAFFISQAAYAKPLYYDINWDGSGPGYHLEINGVLSNNGDFRINSWTIDGVEPYKITIEDRAADINYFMPDFTEIGLPFFEGYFEGFDFVNDRVSGGNVLEIYDPNALLTLDNLGNYLPINASTLSGPLFFHRIYGFDEWGPNIVTISEHKMNDPVPEPATMLLVGVGLAGLVGMRLRKKQ